MSEIWNRSKPPNEQYVAAKLHDGTIVFAMAYYGRDGTLPHWRTKEGAAYSVDSVKEWQPLPFQEMPE